MLYFTKVASVVFFSSLNYTWDNFVVRFSDSTYFITCYLKPLTRFFWFRNRLLAMHFKMKCLFGWIYDLLSDKKNVCFPVECIDFWFVLLVFTLGVICISKYRKHWNCSLILIKQKCTKTCNIYFFSVKTALDSLEVKWVF